MILTFLHLAIFRIPLFSIGIRVPPLSYIRNAYCVARYIAQKLNSSKNMSQSYIQLYILYSTRKCHFRNLSKCLRLIYVRAPVSLTYLLTCSYLTLCCSTLGKKPCHCHENIQRQGVLIL